jgi:hypothetical protein
VAWETKDTIQTIVAFITVCIAGASLYTSHRAYEAAKPLDEAQLSQIKAILAATPTGRIVTLHNGQNLSHRSGPLTVKAYVQHDLGNGDWWLIVHKPLDPTHDNDADTYYPTPRVQPGYKFENVSIGVPTDTEAKSYDVGLYFCNSGASVSLRNFVASNQRSKGLPALPAGCQPVNDIKVTRLGP